MFKKILLFFCISLFVAPANLNASAFSQDSCLRKSLRIAGGLGLVTLFAERMISYSKKEHEFDMLDALVSFYFCYRGFKILSHDL